MRTLIWFTSVAMVSAGVATSVSAASCKDLADQCVIKYRAQNNDDAVRNGTKACYAAERMAACKKTLTYDTPWGPQMKADRP